MYQYKHENTLLFFFLIVILGAFDAPACVRPCLRTPVRIAYACTHCVRLYALRTALNGRDFLGEVNGQAKTSKREGTY